GALSPVAAACRWPADQAVHPIVPWPLGLAEGVEVDPHLSRVERGDRDELLRARGTQSGPWIRPGAKLLGAGDHDGGRPLRDRLAACLTKDLPHLGDLRR